MYTTRYLLLSAALSLSACSGAGLVQDATTGTDATTQTQGAIGAQDLSFMDAQYFDQAVADLMQQSASQINVGLPTRFTTNKVPERLDKWLSAVQNSGGKVQLKPTSEAKSANLALETLLYAAYSIYETYQANLMYSPASNYNAVLYYSKAIGSEDTWIEKVVFTQR
jgi:hypothetical protein